MKSSAKLLVLFAAVLALPGCKIFRDSCDAPPTAEESATVPPLRAPAGLEPPDTRNALRIPELKEPEKPPRPKDGPCLEQPPTFTPGWQPEAAKPGEKTGADQPTPDTEQAPPPKKKRRQ